MTRITGNTISILCQDDVHITISNKVSQSIEPRTVQIRSRYPILELSYDLILILLAVLSQGLKLLTEGVPLIPLLLFAHLQRRFLHYKLRYKPWPPFRSRNGTTALRLIGGGGGIFPYRWLKVIP